jgi:putative transposase
VRQPRIKTAPSEGEAFYHCTSQTVNGERLFDDVSKEVLRRQLWQVADYCGVSIVTYAILENHFHVVVNVPLLQPVSDAELLRRYRVLHPVPTPRQPADCDVIEAELRRNGREAVQWREQQLAGMGDVSQFMKRLKERFSAWFNKSHQRFGTLWAERFKSTLVEFGADALQSVAAYVDLNSVRAGLVADPKEYRFSGYAEAVAGNEAARAGLSRVVGALTWEDTQAQYRAVLFGTGSGVREGAASISRSEFQRVLEQGGKLPLYAVLRCRVRYFSDGAILGSRAFVQTHLAKLGSPAKGGQTVMPRPLPPWTEWGDLVTLRGVRQRSLEWAQAG